MQIPPILRQTLETYATNFSRKELITAGARISKRYRRLDQEDVMLGIHSNIEAMAYGATRMPATYAAVSRTLAALKQGLQDFSPITILDVGAGPATATFAALDDYPSLSKLTLIELNTYLLQFGEKLLHTIYPQLQPIWLKQDISLAQLNGQYDLVLCTYVLNEIEQEKGKSAVEASLKKLWQSTAGVLVLVEPGTSAGYTSLMERRQWLIEAGAFIVAPCPHSKSCPLVGHQSTKEKWCHFSVRVERSKLHRELKQDAVLSYEDEKFSYLIVARQQATPIEQRLIGHPRGTKLVEVDACLHSGEVKHLHIGKSHPKYKIFRKAQWGDGV